MIVREKIIVFISVACVIGLAVWSFAGKKTVERDALSGAELSIDDLRKRVNDIDDEISALNDGDLYRYIAISAERPWAQDPFLEYTSSYELDDQSYGAGAYVESEPLFEYSGYIRVGRKVMVVIDGVDYSLGDEVGDSGAIVKEIRPNSVSLEQSYLSMGEGQVKPSVRTMIIPISE